MMMRNRRGTTDKPKRALFVFCLLCLSLLWAGAALAAGSGNTVVVSGDHGRTVDVVGGESDVTNDDAEANDNNVTVSDSDGDFNVYGGRGTVTGDGSATANGNSVSITSGSNLTDNSGAVNGGYSEVGNDGSATANNNSVSFINSEHAGYVNGGYSYVGNDGSATANGNSVGITNGSTVSDVRGGYAGVANDGDAAANNNNIAISGSTVDNDVFGGYASTSGTGSATANGNSVLISNSEVNNYLYGGVALINSTGTATASGNSVVINNSAVNVSEVYGGYIMAYAAGADRTAINNTVTLAGNTNVTGGLFGGGISSYTALDIFSGNVLNVLNPKAAGIGVGGDVKNFESYNFLFQADAPDGAVGLDLSGGAGDVTLFDAVTGKSSTINVNIMGGGLIPTKLQLFGGAGAVYTGGLFTTMTFTGKKGTALLLDYEFNPATGIAAVTNIQAHPQTKALPEGRAAGAAFLNSGADLISESGMSNAWGRQPGSFGSYSFGGASYSDTRTDTGSHVDVEGFSVMGGLAKDFRKAGGRLTLGVFLEAGWGNYDGFNDFSGYASVNSSGDTDYYGLGIAACYDSDGNEHGHFYGDGALRFGKTDTDFTSNLLDPIGVAARYDSDATYFGAHFGFGYIRNLSESSDLDIYTKLLWTRQGSDTVTTSTGDPITFDKTDSVRWRTGLRYSKLARDNKFCYYIGAAYEHEFGGDADATAYGRYAIDAPSLKGGTGIGEIGFTYQKSPTDPFSMGLNVSGYTGQREGFSGRLEFNWDF